MTRTCPSCNESIVAQGFRAHRDGLRCVVLTACRRRGEEGLVPVPSQRGMTDALRRLGARVVMDYVRYSPGASNRRASVTRGPYIEPAALAAAQMTLWFEWLNARRKRERGDEAIARGKRDRALRRIVSGDVAWKYLALHPDGSLRSYWDPTVQYRPGQPVTAGQPQPNHASGIYVCRTRRAAFRHGYSLGRVLVIGRADYTSAIEYGDKIAVREFTPIAVVNGR